MKISELKKRLQKDRPMSAITLQMPEDVVEEMKRIAPMLGYSNYEALIRHYVGQGLRLDKEKLDNSGVEAFVASLKRQ